jgi:hypothetical protein
MRRVIAFLRLDYGRRGVVKDRIPGWWVKTTLEVNCSISSLDLISWLEGRLFQSSSGEKKVIGVCWKSRRF